MTSYRNILIVKLSAIGDVIHALPVAHALKHAYPQARIVWVVEQPAYELVANSPCVDEVLLFDKAKFRSLSGLLHNLPVIAKQLRVLSLDVAIDLQGLFKSAAIMLLSAAPERLVYCNTRELSHTVSRRICGSNRDGHVVERYLDVARHLGCTVEEPVFPICVPPVAAAQVESLAARVGLSLDKPYVLLAPGTNWLSKCWPPAYFAQLADKLYDMGVPAVLCGSRQDRQRAEDIMAQTRIPPLDLTGQTSLLQLAHLCRKARLFIGGDTGTLHLAAAVATPVVAIFGPTDPKRNGPYGQQHTVLTVPATCAGCWRRTCPKQQDCLAGVTVERVYGAVGSYI